MTGRSHYFEYIGDASAIWRGYKWFRVERYRYETNSGHPLAPSEALEFYLTDQVFCRSFYAPRVNDVPGVHGPFVADELSSLGLSAYEAISPAEFRASVERILADNFGSPEERTSSEQHRVANAKRVLDAIISPNTSAVFRLRTESIAGLKHESAFIFDYYAEFILIDPTAGELQTCVIAAD